ncbi:MAG: MBL fold metallo-hydrolase [Oscillospiraceae bacterium]|nr:MBL fold metallo-hydrolase [Oscillospiraceae bacterium]
MLSKRISIDERLSYWKASQEPLSADIGVLEGDKYTWIFDVGNSLEAADCIRSIPGPKRVVLSHFHQDHIGNWREVEFETLYQGAYTFRHTGVGEIIRGSLTLEDGASIRLFEIPSSHAKGCIGMEVDEKYVFLGDATYCARTQGRPAYNANLLADELRVLRALKAQYFLLSHNDVFIRRKEEVLAELEEIYACRDSQSTYIFLE